MTIFQRTGIAVAVSACLVMGTAASAQDNRAPYFSRAQVEQFVAPVALYPDALLAQIFMASTYPAEVVDANGWTQQNSRLQGDSLADALDERDWDVSVKSLVPFPDVLSRMAQNEAWTQDLGDAFLAQPDDVMDAVQRLRRDAYDAGNLRTSRQQQVLVEPQHIRIVPVSVTIIYLPAYNPMVVYGPRWGYPTYYYPAMMAPPPYYRSGSVISFSIGFSLGPMLFGAFDWNQHNVYYGPNFYQYRGYRRCARDWRHHHPGGGPGDRDQWEHNPDHRGTGGYRNPALEQRYGRGAKPQPDKDGQNRSEPRADADSPDGDAGRTKPAPRAKPHEAPKNEAGRPPTAHPVEPAPRAKPHEAPKNEAGKHPDVPSSEPAKPDRAPKDEEKKDQPKK